MNNWRNVLENAKNLTNNIAKDIYKPGSYLECKRCGFKKELTEEGIAHRLTFGWEKCCGYTMSLVAGDETER